MTHKTWSLANPNTYAGCGQSLLVLTDLAWNEERPPLIFLSLFKKLSFVVLIWAEPT